MSLREAAPGEGARGTRTHFTYVETHAGKNWFGYIAGRCWWGICHPSERSKPCLHWITSGQLACRLCGGKREPEMMGYQPLYRHTDGKPVLAIFYEDMRDRVDAMKFHERVQIGREGGKGDACWIQKAMDQNPKYQTTLAVRMAPAHITENLLMMWKVAELTEWYRCQAPTSDNAVSLVKEAPVKSDGKPFDPMHAAAARRYAPPVAREVAAEQAVDEAKESILKKARAMESRNGNGKHKPGEPH